MSNFEYTSIIILFSVVLLILLLTEPVKSDNIFRHGQFVYLENDFQGEYDNTFSDPQYSRQEWVYDMVNVQAVWRMGYRGRGVRVRINDNGVDSTSHKEFLGRFDVKGSCEHYEPETSDDGHGTSVASIVGAASNNRKCAVGIAPRVILSSCYVFDAEWSVLTENLNSFDISQNAWGIPTCSASYRRFLQVDDETQCPFQVFKPEFVSPCEVCDFSLGSSSSEQCEEVIADHCSLFFVEDNEACIEFLDWYLWNGECTFNILSDDARTAITEGVRKGRNGKGIIFVFASGNDFSAGGDTNLAGLTSSRFVISVGALAKDGRHASYSTPGASLFVTAPGGDYEFNTNHVAVTAGGKCVNAGYGTSFASPVVSGVIALMLEANPDLTWRDVQSILATTSRKLVDPQDDTATVNGAGIWHSNWYGFGVVDAFRAVLAARKWTSPGDESFVTASSGIVNLPIHDALSNATATSFVEISDTGFIAESVVVYLEIEHFSRGHLQVVLTSPSGTESVLLPGGRPENTILEEGAAWKVMTVRNWGESALGQWDLTIEDLREGDVAECADLPWAPTAANGGIWTCNAIAEYELCANGLTNAATIAESAILELEHNGRAAVDACCLCGGGLNSNDIEDKLIRWRLVVFGYEAGAVVEEDDQGETTEESETVEETTIFTVGQVNRAPLNAGKSSSLRAGKSKLRVQGADTISNGGASLGLQTTTLGSTQRKPKKPKFLIPL